MINAKKQRKTTEWEKLEISSRKLDTKGTFHAKMGSIKDKNGMDWTEADREGNGNLLRYSCLENPRDRGAWWAAIYGVAQSRTRLKRLSSSSSIATLGAIFKGKKKATKIFSNNSNNKNHIYINPLLSTELVCKYNCFQSSCILYYKIKCNTAFIFSSYFQNVHTADEILRPFYKRVVFSI